MLKTPQQPPADNNVVPLRPQQQAESMADALLTGVGRDVKRVMEADPDNYRNNPAEAVTLIKLKLGMYEELTDEVRTRIAASMVTAALANKKTLEGSIQPDDLNKLQMAAAMRAYAGGSQARRA